MPPATARKRQPVTEKQTAVLDAAQRFLDERERMPSYRELAEYMGSKLSTVYQHVLLLEKKGRVRREPGIAGGWHIVKQLPKNGRKGA